MVVGMAVSELIDKPENKMNFESDDMHTSEAEWYRELTHIKDEAGSLDDIRLFSGGKQDHQIVQLGLRKDRETGKLLDQLRRKPPASKPPSSTANIPSGIRIVDLDDGDSEEDDLVPYRKPDSDPEDEEDDPTLVQRNKPLPPVYIRDLISGLRDTEDYDRYKLSLETASSLIRRKANFGREVSDHIFDLISALLNLSDAFELSDFQELRQQALIAVLIADPTQIAQYLARSLFEGDYSISQRLAILTTLGLGARELAGFKSEDGDFTGANAVPSSSFPSQSLPEKLHKIYAPSSQTTVEAVSAKLERKIMEPMALSAADALTGPNALKVRTFSSRMQVEKKRKKPIPNALAKIVAESFFFPLTGRWWSHVQAYGQQNMRFSPHLLPPYLKTLALILHASGPGTLSLPQMTSEFFDLLLNVRGTAVGDIAVLEAVLFGLLTLLEINEDKRRLATEHSKELLESQEWARGVLESVGQGEEEGRVRMLAAGVVVRSQEVVKEYQRLLMGDMIDL